MEVLLYGFLAIISACLSIYLFKTGYRLNKIPPDIWNEFKKTKKISLIINYL